jgi:hypothetical protein
MPAAGVEEYPESAARRIQYAEFRPSLQLWVAKTPWSALSSPIRVRHGGR